MELRSYWFFKDETIRSLTNHDGDGDDYENVMKSEFAPTLLQTYSTSNLTTSNFRAYFISFNSTNVGRFFWSLIPKDCIEVQKEKKKVVVLCPRSSKNVKLGNFTS